MKITNLFDVKYFRCFISISNVLQIIFFSTLSNFLSDEGEDEIELSPNKFENNNKTEENKSRKPIGPKNKQRKKNREDTDRVEGGEGDQTSQG